MAKFNGIAIADPSKKNLNFTSNEGFYPTVEGLNSDKRTETDKNLKSTVIEGVTSSMEIEAHYDNVLKDDQLPHLKQDVHSTSVTNDPQDITQEAFLKSKEDYESVKPHRTELEVTVPLDNDEHREVDDSQYAEEVEAKADVEEAILEAGKKITDMNGAGYYDPGMKEKINHSQFDPKSKNLEPVQKYGRPKTDNPTLVSNPQDYADEKNYLYTDTGTPNRNFQERYYKNNPWRDGYRDGTNPPVMLDTKGEPIVDPDTGRVHLYEAPRTPSRLG